MDPASKTPIQLQKIVYLRHNRWVVLWFSLAVLGLLASGMTAGETSQLASARLLPPLQSTQEKSKAEASQPESFHTAPATPAKLESSSTNSPRLELTEPENSQPAVAKPAVAKPAVAKPEPATPEPAKPEPAKPDNVKSIPPPASAQAEKVKSIAPPGSAKADPSRIESTRPASLRDLTPVPGDLTPAHSVSTVPTQAYPTYPVEQVSLLDLSAITDLPTVPGPADIPNLPAIPGMPGVAELSMPTEQIAAGSPAWLAAYSLHPEGNLPTGADNSATLPLTAEAMAPAGSAPNPPPQWLQHINQPLLRYSNQQQLSLFDALMRAISFSPEIEVVRTELGIREQEIERQKGAFNWTQFIETKWDEQNQPVASRLDGVSSRLEQHTLNASAGVRKLNALGGQAEISQELGFRDSNSSFFNPNNQAVSGIALQYRQPLLRGAGRTVNLGQIQIASTDANISYEQMVAGIQQQLGEVAQAYWDLVRLRGNYVIQLENNQRTQQIAQILKNRQDVDIGPVRLARIESAVTSSQADALRAEYAVVQAQDRLLRLIYGASFIQNADIETIPECDYVGEVLPLDQEFHVQLALQNRPEVLQAIQSIRRASAQNGIAKNQLLPLLGLTLSLSNRGTVGNRLLGSAYSDQWSLGDPSYGIGLAYERPYSNQAAKATLNQTRLRLFQLQKQFEQTVADVVVDMRNALREVELSDQRRRLAEETMILTYRELTAQEQRLKLLLDGDQVGVLYLENLLQTQNRVASSSQQYLDTTVSFFNSYFQLQRTNGTLVRREHPPTHTDR